VQELLSLLLEEQPLVLNGHEIIMLEDLFDSHGQEHPILTLILRSILEFKLLLAMKLEDANLIVLQIQMVEIPLLLMEAFNLVKLLSPFQLG